MSEDERKEKHRREEAELYVNTAGGMRKIEMIGFDKAYEEHGALD